MNRRSLFALALLPFLGACADDTYAVVSVLTYSGSIDGVTQFRVRVESGSAQDVLYYPQQPTESLHLDTTHPITFSVQFSASHAGPATFEVEPLGATPQGAAVGYGKVAGTIEKGKVVNVAVVVVLGALRPEHGVDAGAGDSGTSQLSCDPYAPGSACGANQTCGLLCSADQPAVGMCYAAGPGTPGAACASNNDCVPGSQCFTFTATGCSVMTCLRFCNSDTMCGEPNAFCNVPIQCGSTPPFTACSRPCDPTGTGTVGCAVGLSCFVYAGETTDCACPGQGDVGAACTQNSGCNGEALCAGCRAGLSCVVPAGSAAGSGSGVCRPICTLATPACPSGTTCHAFDGSTRLVHGFCQ